ncbi:Trypsin [Candidatus Nitrosotenuis uzonensis]|uniref:Trypsin n=1 Tax=Candidatus Nitrosotenuis uzonensis TaxID=1407055 RepID=A0A812F0P1_9ARCH|nr:Trypsin [Candidatus Nitrosotenuis uzonensis]
MLVQSANGCFNFYFALDNNVTRLNKKEKILLSVIGILLITLGLNLLVDLGHFVARSESDLQLEKTPTINEIPKPESKPPDSVTSKNQLTILFKRVENSVVQITSKVSEKNQFITINGDPMERQSSRLGSGFVYDKDGRIITNNHVVENADDITVTFVDGNTYSVKVIGSDKFNDIAVLQITDDFSDEDLVPLSLGDSSQLEVGQQVVAIGNPYGLSDTMTTGIISQKGRLLPTQESGFSIPNVIQTDAAINPGNSGGPLLNMDGEIIGINTAIQSMTGEFSGIGFAVPSNTVKKVVPELIKNGKYAHPWLGIAGTNMTPDISKSLGVPKNYKGIFVSKVIKDGPADRAGILEATFNANGEAKSGDIIISIDGRSVRGMDDLILYISDNKEIGNKVQLTINRNNEIIDVYVTLQERPAN